MKTFNPHDPEPPKNIPPLSEILSPKRDDNLNLTGELDSLWLYGTNSLHQMAPRYTFLGRVCVMFFIAASAYGFWRFLVWWWTS